MRLANVAAAITTAIMVFGCAPAAVAQNNSDTCADAYLAVGGWPAVDRVPAGFEYVPTPGGIFPFERGGYNHGQDVGAANFVAAADAHFAECPDTRLYAQGHSYGAGVVHRALATIDTRDYAPKVHVYLTGDPLYPGGVDDAWKGWEPLPGVKFRGAGVIPQNLGSYENVCHVYNDAICSMPLPWRQPREFMSSIIGYFNGGHSYPVRPAQPW